MFMLATEFLRCCVVGRCVGVGRVEGVLLVCMGNADRVLTLVDFVVTASALLLCFLLHWTLDWQFDSGYHCFVIASHVDMSSLQLLNKALFMRT